MLRMRLLAVVRLSDLTDDSTSPERQRTRITTYAKLHDHEVVGLAEDLDVSGAVSPFDRPQLGPWLMRLVEWGDLVIAKYDRLTRSLLDFLMLYEWLRDRGKTLIWIDPAAGLLDAVRQGDGQCADHLRRTGAGGYQ